MHILVGLSQSAQCVSDLGSDLQSRWVTKYALKGFVQVSDTFKVFALLASKNKAAVKLGLRTNRLKVSQLLLSAQLHWRGGFIWNMKG